MSTAQTDRRDGHCLDHVAEINARKRFEFGKNWEKFLKSITEERIQQAEASLKNMLCIQSLEGKTFIDVGSGSGLFSLAARRLGALVKSLDYDPQSVACTDHLKQQFYPGDLNWQVERGSITDDSYINALGQWDVVYSWGVLHHTGEMWKAMSNASALVKPGGQLFIAIYNDQGTASRRWLSVKRAYNGLPHGLKWLVLIPAFIRLWGPTTIRDAVKGRPFHTWHNYSRNSQRGMSPWVDVVDWVGGLPFEVAKPEEIFLFLRDRGFVLEQMKTCGGGLGCNEFVFRASFTV